MVGRPSVMRQFVTFGLILAVFGTVSFLVPWAEKTMQRNKNAAQAGITSQPKTSTVVDEDLYRGSKTFKLEPVQDEMIPLEPNTPMPAPTSKPATDEPEPVKSLLKIKVEQVDG